MSEIAVIALFGVIVISLVAGLFAFVGLQDMVDGLDDYDL